MSNNEILTVQQFAEAAGISKQAVYKALNNKLKPFVQLVDGKKMIHSKALTEVYGVAVNQHRGNPEGNQSQPLETLIAMLQKELDAKNEQISAQQRQLEAKDEQIRQLNERLRESHEAFAIEQETAQRAQALHAGTLQQLQTPAEPEVVVENPAKSDPGPGEPTPQEKKSGLWARMFGKKGSHE